MSSLAYPDLTLRPSSPALLVKLSALGEELRSRPQIQPLTDHIIHGGMYIRTLHLPANVDMMGSLILKATVLIVCGSCSMLAGDERVELEGYNVLPGCAGRKQLFTTRSPVVMTMIFPTSASTVEEAENEVFGESDLLQSRQDSSGDTVIITGE